MIQGEAYKGLKCIDLKMVRLIPAKDVYPYYFPRVKWHIYKEK